MAANWQVLLKQVAPWIAAAASGNVPALVGMAATTIGSALGSNINPTVSAIGQALANATPEQMLAIKNADNDFAIKMQSLGFQDVETLEKIAADDRASARTMQMATRSNMPAVITCLLLLLWAVFEGSLIAGVEPHIAPELVGGILRTLDNLLMVSVAFWFGTTADSGRKTEIMAAK